MDVVDHLRALGESNAQLRRRPALRRDTALAAAAVYGALFEEETADGRVGVPATFQARPPRPRACCPDAPSAAPSAAPACLVRVLPFGRLRRAVPNEGVRQPPPPPYADAPPPAAGHLYDGLGAGRVATEAGGARLGLGVLPGTLAPRTSTLHRLRPARLSANACLGSARCGALALLPPTRALCC